MSPRDAWSWLPRAERPSRPADRWMRSRGPRLRACAPSRPPRLVSPRRRASTPLAAADRARVTTQRRQRSHRPARRKPTRGTSRAPARRTPPAQKKTPPERPAPPATSGAPAVTAPPTTGVGAAETGGASAPPDPSADQRCIRGSRSSHPRHWARTTCSVSSGRAAAGRVQLAGLSRWRPHLDLRINEGHIHEMFAQARYRRPSIRDECA